MKKGYLFTREEIPFELLKKYGISQEMIDDLPEEVENRLLLGIWTPLLPIVTENIEGLLVTTQSQISLVRLEDESVDLVFRAKWWDSDLKSFSEQQQKDLQDGKVIKSYIVGKGECYLQFWDIINQVIGLPVSIVKQNVYLLGRDYNLTNEQMTLLMDGELLEFKNNKGSVMTAGIDLVDEGAVRVVKGDSVTWKENAKELMLPRYNFGSYGCWLYDGESLSYIKEDDYTEEIQAELSRVVAAKKAAGQMESQVKMK